MTGRNELGKDIEKKALSCARAVHEVLTRFDSGDSSACYLAPATKGGTLCTVTFMIVKREAVKERMKRGDEAAARLPPSLDPKVNTTPPAWASPPSGWIYGNWKITYSSNVGYQYLYSLEFDSSPILPTCFSPDPAAYPLSTFPGQNVDLQTWSAAANDSVGNSSTVLSAFGVDTPRRTDFSALGRGWDSVFDFAGTGALAGVNNTWELLAWGCDEKGDGHMAIYETAVSSGYAPPEVDIESRSEAGPSAATLEAIYRALRALGNEDLDALVANVTKLTVDGRRDGQPPFVFGPSCVNNTGP